MDPCHSRWADWLEETWASSRPGTLLDLCCGTGLMTRELIARGHDVVGVDASTAMLARARTRLGPSARLVQTWLPQLPELSELPQLPELSELPELSQLSKPGPFDGAVSTLDGLNYLSLADLQATFTALARVLRPGGWFVFDVHGPGMLSFARAHPVITGTRDGCAFTLATEVEGQVCRSTIDFSGDDDRPSFTETHTQRVHAREELDAALATAGFAVLAVTDEYSDAAATVATLRATWVARLEES